MDVYYTSKQLRDTILGLSKQPPNSSNKGVKNSPDFYRAQAQRTDRISPQSESNKTEIFTVNISVIDVQIWKKSEFNSAPKLH